MHLLPLSLLPSCYEVSGFSPTCSVRGAYATTRVTPCVQEAKANLPPRKLLVPCYLPQQQLADTAMDLFMRTVRCGYSHGSVLANSEVSLAL